MVVQTVLVELPQLQFIDSRRYFNCVAEAVVVPAGAAAVMDVAVLLWW